jgi:hypothetical protein
MTFGAAFWSRPDESAISSSMRSTNPGTRALLRHPYRCSRHLCNRRQRVEAVRVGKLPARPFLEAIMKAILSATLVLGLCGLAGAQGDKADPVGTWKCEYEIGSLKWMSTT